MVTYLTSKEIKSVLGITDCELMHLRDNQTLQFVKKGCAYYYHLPENISLLQHPIGEQLLNWHRQKHGIEIENSPTNIESKRSLEALIDRILLPVERRFERPFITYGFTSTALASVIKRKYPSGTAPQLDQHACYDENSAGMPICRRGGAACDFFVEGISSAVLTRYITSHLDFDRIYYYGSDRPIHVSVHIDNPVKHLQLMHISKNGRRYPSTKAFGDDAIELSETL